MNCRYELNPKIRTKPNGGVLFMKLSYEDKVRMYHSWKALMNY